MADIAKQLLDSGAITQSTYDAMVGNAQSNPATVNPGAIGGTYTPPAQAQKQMPAIDPSWLQQGQGNQGPQAPALPPVSQTSKDDLFGERGGKAAPAASPGRLSLDAPPNEPSKAEPGIKEAPRPEVKAEAKPDEKVSTPVVQRPEQTPEEKTVPKTSGGSSLGPYDTRLSPDDEADFKLWKKEYAPKDSGADYDLRGAFKAGVTPDPENGHWPDTFKKPNHPTFSDQSQYAVGDNASKAGHWEGDTFVPPPRNSTELRTRQLTGRLGLSQQRAEAEKTAEDRSASAYVKGQEDTATAINTRLTDEQEMMKRRDAMQQQAYQTAQKAYDDLQARNKALGETNIDPDRKWKNLTGGGKALTGVAMLLGGLSQGMLVNAGAKGASNPAIDMWQRDVDRDIQAQVHDIQNKKDAIQTEGNVIAKKYAVEGDMVGYQTTKNLEAWQTVSHQIDSYAATTKSEQAKANLDKAKLVIDGKVDEARNQLQDYAYGKMQQREQQAAAAAQAQAARVEKTRQEVRELTKQLVQGDANRLPMSLEDAQRLAYSTITGINPGGGVAPKVEHVEKGGAAKEKDLGERSVVVDGKDALAVSKTAAEKWAEYNHGREVFALSLDKLKKAREAGDVGAYNAARAQLIEEYPKLLGYTRAPTEGQIKHTVGPEAIPEYNHWFSSGPAYGVMQSRGAEKIKFLDQTLATSDKAMRQNTFGANAPTAGGASSKPKLPDMPDK